MPTDTELRDTATSLAAQWPASVVDVEFPVSGGNPPISDSKQGWVPPDGYWSAECPPQAGPVVLVIEARDQVSGVVPGDGVVLLEGGRPHSVGVVSQLSYRDAVIRVVIEKVRPIPEPEKTAQ